MTEEEWAKKMALCKNFAVEEMKKTSQSEKNNTATGLFFFFEATISFRASVFDETRILLGNISIIFFLLSAKINFITWRLKI